jgi:hypothetical protein
MRSFTWSIGTVACGILLMGIIARPALAIVKVTGSVWLLPPDGSAPYADDPFTTDVNEGIPNDGNTLNIFGDATNQIGFEGRPDVLNNTNINFSVLVGRASYGELLVSESQLRDMDLIIGDQAMVGGILTRGTGVVRIDGFGGLYNNDPSILPYLGPGSDPDNPTSPSVAPREMEAGADMGFDLYVGRSGTGDLYITQGGRTEIQDAAIVGDLSGAVGYLSIDGAGSFLKSGGFETDSNNPDDVHYMIVGRLGSGTMSITNGGQALNSGQTMMGNTASVFAAVVGSNLAAVNTNPPAAGGAGTVEVDGLASKWTVAGNLQLGGFHDKRDSTGINSPEDLEGNDVVYASNVGHGTLNVKNGALVSIVTPPLDENAQNAPDRLDFLVGRFGHVNLDGGRIELLGAFNSSDPQNPFQSVSSGRLINDGTVEGNGSISVLQFRNRVLGDVIVRPGQKLAIAAPGTYDEADNIPVNTEQEYPMSNYGLVEVVGNETARAEIQFVRNEVTTPTASDFTRPFLNLPIVDPPFPKGRTGGEIVAADSIMRFDSGIINRHKVSFTGGDNEVVGNFTNEGTVFVGGNNTTVTFVDEFRNLGGVLDVQPNISLVMFLDNLTLGGSGALSTTFGGRPTGQEISHISSAEDLFLGGALSASLFTAPGVPTFSPQPGDQFAIISTAGELVGDFASVQLPGCINGGTTCFVGFPDYNVDAYFIQAFGVPAAGGGADFNGDGIVDEIDLAVWRQNLGSPGPAGDANGDGIVNSIDFFIWQDQIGTPGMPPGAGAGSAGLGAVPEPASLAMLLSGSLLALAWRRRPSI